jgi:hypothetical protein
MRIAHTHRTLLALHYAQNPITHMKSWCFEAGDCIASPAIKSWCFR